MYTGIVHGTFALAKVVKKPGLSQLFLDLPAELLEDLQIGASVGLDGVCMTVTEIQDGRVAFDAMQETLTLTTLGGLEEGDRVNVERSAKQGAEIGGHNISGHIDAMVELTAIEHTENNCTLRFAVPLSLRNYVFKKGFIGLNGCSLTVADYQRDSGEFSVCLIPETLRVTNFGLKQVGDKVNIEIDRQTQVIVDTVERVLAERGNR
jgi:riboflavin synthase